MSKEKNLKMETISNLKSNWQRSLDDVIQETVANLSYFLRFKSSKKIEFPDNF